jgi:hypothetical protein
LTVDKIDACEGLIQIVGHGYGAAPPMVDANYGRVSYTQFKFLYACEKKKKTWLLFAGDARTRELARGCCEIGSFVLVLVLLLVLETLA